MKDLYFLRYNNYINRKVKLPKTLDQYRAFEVGEPMLNVNFHSDDGIHAEKVVNVDFDILGAIPDYAIITRPGSSAVEEHWYILEADKICKGQYNLIMQRDTILDYKDVIMRAKAVIARGTVAQTNPFIYNSEDSKLNVIKKDETLLKDYTQVPWIVGYVSQDVAKDNPRIPVKTFEQQDADYEDITEYPFYQYTKTSVGEGDNFLAVSYNMLYRGSYSPTALLLKLAPVAYTPASGPLYYVNSPMALDDNPENAAGAIQRVRDKWAEVSYDRKLQIANANPEQGVSREIYDQILAGQNKTIKTRSGNYIYKVVTEGYTLGQSIDEQYVIDVMGCFNSPSDSWTNKGQMTNKQINYVNITFHLEFEQVEASGLVQYEINFSGKDLSNKTSPYGIICMPYADGYRTLSTINDAQKGQTMTKSQRLKLFQALGAVKGLIYDIQILPYCPISTITFSGNDMYNVARIRTIPVTSPSTAGLVTNFYCAESGEFDFRIRYIVNATDVKTTNECDIWRIVSPNGAGNFEFNASKLGIHTMPTEPNYFLRYVYVDCSYRPFTPYIHIAPQWGGLYGDNYHDPKGLICAGDFSVDRVDDQWETYQYNNKNFQLQFDRQIETMEFNKKMGWLGPIGGMLGGAAGLASAVGIPDWLEGGAYHSGLSPMAVKSINAASGYSSPVSAGAIAKTAGAMAGSLAVGIAQHMRHNEAIAARKDDFNWTNQNIDARPYGLTKVSTLNNNNKLFPYIEHYSCTDEEREQVQTRLTLQGMTVGAIGKIEDYLNINPDGTHKYPVAGGLYNRNYVRATIIEMPEDLDDDANLAMAINDELAEGVYFEE